MSKNLMQRTLFGLLFVGVMLFGITYSAVSFGLLFLLLSMLTSNELVGLLNRLEGVNISRPLALASSAVLFLLLWIYHLGLVAHLLLSPYYLMVVGALVVELYRRSPNPVFNWMGYAFVQLYVALPFALLCTVAFRQTEVFALSIYTPLVPLAVFVGIWINDTGAYCVGSLMGRHRLFERISPRKSWEGFWGGMLFVLIGAAVAWHYVGVLSLWQWLVLGVLISSFGTLGDLVESLLKRTLHVKDSGSAIPGHGGFLDRFDSSLLVIPVVVMYLHFYSLF